MTSSSSSSFKTTQAGVLKGMGTAAAIIVALYGVVIHHASSTYDDGPSTNDDDNHGNRVMAFLILAVKSLILPALCLGVNIGIIAKHRFFTPDDINGGGLTKGTPTINILQATLQNTLEQACLATLVYLCSSVHLPYKWGRLLPQTASMLFFVGRILFWKGYSSGAPSRAMGFALTFYSTMFLLLINMFHLIRTEIYN